MNYVLNNGTGIIDIKGTNDCTIFYYQSQKKILAWQMNWDTLFDYFVGSVPSKLNFDVNTFYKLAEKLEKGNIDEDKLHIQLKPILRMFINGTYELSIKEFHQSSCIVHVGKNKNYYPKEKRYEISKEIYSGCEPFPFYAIQEQINEKRVDYYLELIKQNKTPLPIIFKAKKSDIKFVIDGHHKLNAYKKANKIIRAIVIEKINNYELENKKILRIYKSLSNDNSLFEKLETHLDGQKK
jgi:hypothetical protein